MKNTLSWQEILTHPQAGHHIAQVYQDMEFLAEAVGLFISAGLRANEGVIVIAKKPHWQAFLQQIEKNGFDPKAAVARGQIEFYDAERTLSKFMVKEKPDWSLFQGLIGDALDKLKARYPVIRAYGEMVNILWQKGQLNAAVCVEEQWNKIHRLRDFSLFCAYLMDNLDKKVYQGALQSLCKTHSHLIPAQDYRQFEKNINQASRETLGQSLADMLRLMNDDDKKNAHMPSGQATLLWLQQHMPKTADMVLSRARVLRGFSKNP